MATTYAPDVCCPRARGPSTQRRRRTVHERRCRVGQTPTRSGAAAGSLASGDGGLWFAHPRIAGPPTPVLGLPASLTGRGTTIGGAASVARNPTDERLAVGEVQTGGMSCALHVLTLVGRRVARDRVFRVGTVIVSAPHGGVDACAWLPDGRVLFTARGIAAGPSGSSD